MLSTYPGKNPLESYIAVRADPIGFFSEVARECGDLARIKILAFQYYLVNDPELIREALIDRSELLVIRGGASAGLARLIGNGILTNRGERWRESRRKLQPLFHGSSITSYAPILRERIRESLDRWKSRFRDRPFPINRELLALSFRIKCSTLFSYLPSFEEAEAFADAISTLQGDGMKRYLRGVDLIPWLPLSLNRHVNLAKATLRALARKCTDQPVDEVLSLLFAGTESPVNVICWALKYLQDHVEWSSSSSERLSQVLNETLRLQPAGWAFERYAREATTLGGERIDKGARLLFSPYLLHRNPRFWKDAEKFDPARFEPGSSAPSGVPKYAYLPFGAGPRSCIGSRLAWEEMLAFLTLFLERGSWKIHEEDPPLASEGSFKIRLNRSIQLSLQA